MRVILLRFYVLVLAVLGGSASAVMAQDNGPGDSAAVYAPACQKVTDSDAEIAKIVRAFEEKRGWNCGDAGWRADRMLAWLWFDAGQWEGEALPRYFYSRIARHQSITFTALDEDGTARTQRYDESDGRALAAGPVFQVALPEVTAETQAILVRVERPHSVPLLTEARLTPVSGQAEWTQLDIALLALVVGMLILPLLFDISFFVVLREKFIALHALMVASMMGYVLFAGGLITVAITLPVALIAAAGALFWAIGCGVGALFLAAFLEPGTQSPLMRRVTLVTGWWTILVCGFFALQLHFVHPFDDRGYFIAFLPLIVVVTVAIAEALARGSRSARFLAVGWTPVILASIERLLRGVGVYIGPSSLDQMLFLATGIEVVVISLAIAQRFLAVRRERDDAVTEVRMLEQLSTRDSLTGLLNRRAITKRFSELHAQGFDTLALIDLDDFKAVNDRFGHQVGDEALIACADAIRGGEERDTIGVRLGGEEFVVLLRGPSAHARAEAIRRAVPVHITGAVPGLEQPVTASMGLVELPRTTSMPMSFEELYGRADELLYQAKAAGRNRTCFERLTIFTSAPASRRDAELAA
ncbi:MAG: diguanylate cyclase [Erythrobacter sp.]|nr:diguanylate cyclase [Erythrobacter sp.]